MAAPLVSLRLLYKYQVACRNLPVSSQNFPLVFLKALNTTKSEQDGPTVRQHLLEASLKHVPEHGWTLLALEKGAVDVGLPKISHGMCDGGPAELIDFFQMSCRKELKRNFQGLDRSSRGDIIRNMIVARLRMNIPYLGRLPQAIGIMALPQNAVTAWTNLGRLVNDMWHYAGDTSTDLNWYSKRLLLATIYKSSEILMAQDDSEDFEDTWAFVDQRLSEVKAAGKAVSQLKDADNQVFTFISSGLATAANVLNISRR